MPSRRKARDEALKAAGSQGGWATRGGSVSEVWCGTLPGNLPLASVSFVPTGGPTTSSSEQEPPGDIGGRSLSSSFGSSGFEPAGAEDEPPADLDSASWGDW